VSTRVDDDDDLIASALTRLKREDPEAYEELVLQVVIDQQPALVANAIANVVQIMKAGGQTDEEIRTEIAEACAELGINRTRGLN
jgi:hypothetical protein